MSDRASRIKARLASSAARLKSANKKTASMLKSASISSNRKLKGAALRANTKMKESRVLNKLKEAPLNKLRALKRSASASSAYKEDAVAGPSEELLETLASFRLESSDGTYRSKISAVVRGDSRSLQLQWFSCPADGAASSRPLEPLPGITGMHYQPSLDDIGAVLRCVCMSPEGLSASAQTPPLALVGKETATHVEAMLEGTLRPEGARLHAVCIELPTVEVEHDIVVRSDGIRIELSEFSPARRAAATASARAEAAVAAAASAAALPPMDCETESATAARIAVAITTEALAVAMAATVAPRALRFDGRFDHSRRVGGSGRRRAAACVALSKVDPTQCALDIASVDSESGKPQRLHFNFHSEQSCEVFVVGVHQLLARESDTSAAAQALEEASEDEEKGDGGVHDAAVEGGTFADFIDDGDMDETEERESDNGDKQIWWYTDVSASGVGVRREKRYPCERVGVDINGGLRVPIMERVTEAIPLAVAAAAPSPQDEDGGSDDGTAGSSSVEPSTRDVTFLRLADGRGWLFNVSPSNGSPLLRCEDEAGVALSEADAAALRTYASHIASQQQRTVEHLEKRLSAATLTRERVQWHLAVLRRDCTTLGQQLQREEADFHRSTAQAQAAETLRLRKTAELAQAQQAQRNAAAALAKLSAENDARSVSLEAARLRRSNVELLVHGAQRKVEEADAALAEMHEADRERRESCARARRQRLASELRLQRVQERVDDALASRETQREESARLTAREADLTAELATLSARTEKMMVLASELSEALEAKQRELEETRERTRVDDAAWTAKSAELRGEMASEQVASEQAAALKAAAAAQQESELVQAADEVRRAQQLLLAADRDAQTKLEASVASAAERASSLQIESETLRSTLESGIAEKRRLERTLHSLTREVKRVQRSVGGGAAATAAASAPKAAAAASAAAAPVDIESLRARLAETKDSIAGLELHFAHHSTNTTRGRGAVSAADARRRKADLVALARTLTDTQNDRELALAAQQATSGSLETRTRALEAQLDAYARAHATSGR